MNCDRRKFLLLGSSLLANPILAGGQDPETYICPMHAEVVAKRPGQCPKCAMKLVPRSARSALSVWTCTMHPDVLSPEPGRARAAE
jgi:hypothetical protein